MNRYFALMLALTASPAMGHPGHGAAIAGHWVSDPSHLAALAGLGIAALLVLRAVWAHRKSVKLRSKD